MRDDELYSNSGYARAQRAALRGKLPSKLVIGRSNPECVSNGANDEDSHTDDTRMTEVVRNQKSGSTRVVMSHKQARIQSAARK